MNSIWKAFLDWRKERGGLRPVTSCEYWVFLSEESMPTQDEAMAAMLRPKANGTEQVISAREGALFSDVRLSVSLVLRSKNPHAFRPDLLSDHVEPTAEHLRLLSQSKAFVRIRFNSTAPMGDDRHLTFTAHLAAAYAELGRGEVIFDASAQQIFGVEEFRSLIRRDPRVLDVDSHLHVAWSPTELGGVAETCGLTKVGMPELRSFDCHIDQRVLAVSVITAAGEALWRSREVAESLVVRCFDDCFKLEIQPNRSGPYRVRIHRHDQAA